MKLKNCLFLTILFLSVQFLSAQITLPKLISDGMVLQRNTELKIWGWATASEEVTIDFMGARYSCTTNADGMWEAVLPPQKAGGPFTMKIAGENSIEIKDILIGEVWLCSGQSNMAYLLKKSKTLYSEDISNAKNPAIRQFVVPKKFNFKGPQEKLASGTWMKADKNTVGNFSAVAYFFGKELYDTYKVPIGLINSSVGGTPAEAWMPAEGLKDFSNYYNEIPLLKSDSYIDSLRTKNNKKQQNWIQKAVSKDAGYADNNNSWKEADFDDSSWQSQNLPGNWGSKIGSHQGIVWYRKSLELKNAPENKRAKLSFGNISEVDSVFVNGTFIGATQNKFEERNYVFPSEVLKEGTNTIVVKVMCYRGNGGFIKGDPMELVYDDQVVSIATNWKLKFGVKMKPLAAPIKLTRKPTGLYNAMIAPLENYSIKGVIWYQGEGNTSRAMEYKTLFPGLIQNWRTAFQNNELPFLFVQLANFQKPVSKPGPSAWALLREAQLETLKLKHAGMAVTIDIGEANDIHPKNKKDVGLRLALAAKKIAYKDAKVIHSGPQYTAMEIKGNQIILSFETYKSGLKSKNGGELQEFAIAGADQKFVWAKAKIVGDKIIVSSNNISNPIAVRYAWANNPSKANLINDLGLPASPFRTDVW